MREERLLALVPLVQEFHYVQGRPPGSGGRKRRGRCAARGSADGRLPTRATGRQELACLVCFAVRGGGLPCPNAGLSMRLDCLRLDLHASGIAVTAVHVSFVCTPILDHAQHPLSRHLEVDAIVATILQRLPSNPPRSTRPSPWLCPRACSPDCRAGCVTGCFPSGASEARGQGWRKT